MHVHTYTGTDMHREVWVQQKEEEMHFFMWLSEHWSSTYRYMEVMFRPKRKYYISPKHLSFSASVLSHVGVANVINIIKR